MIKKIFLVLFCISINFVYGQSKIIVYNNDIQTPLEGAKIYCKNKLIGTTNKKGELVFNTNCTEIKIKKTGFYTEKAIVDKLVQKSLFAKKSIIEKKLKENSDKKAIDILDKVLDNFEKNSPKSLSSFKYKSYEKLSVDINTDSIFAYNQPVQYLAKSIDKIPWIRKKNKIDTTLTTKKTFTNSPLFLWERAFEHVYSKKYGERKKIIANSIAGIDKPLNELLLIHTNRDGNIPKEILRKNRNIYRYFLTDSVEIDGRKNFVIHFREITYRKSIQNRLYNGYLYIDKETYGIKKIESNSKKIDEYKLTSIWTIKNNKWFLESEHLKTKIHSIKIDPNEDEKLKKFKLFGLVNVQYFDIEPLAEIDKKEYKGYYYQPIENLHNIEELRTTPLSKREKNAYNILPELSKKYNLEKKLNGVASLFNGYLRTDKIDWSLNRFFKYNIHEGIRIGAGAKINENVNSKIKPDAYFAYGLKDQKIKYGVGIEYSLSNKKTSTIRAEYTNDVWTAGYFSQNLWDGIMNISNANISLNNRHLFHAKKISISHINDISNAISIQLSASKSKENMVVPYNLDNRGGNFDLVNTSITIKYAPLFKNVMTDRGKFIIEKQYPEIYVNYEKSWNKLGGNFSYSKVDFLINHYYENKFGNTGFRIYGGKVFGEAPIWQNFSTNGLSSGKGINYALFSYLGFATMPSGKYYNDKFVGLYFTHTLPWHFKSIGQNTSSFAIVHRSIIGNMNNRYIHNIDFKPLNRLYQEVGIEWNNFLSSSFNLGIFYRIGHYNTPKFSENIGFLFKFKLLGF